MPRKNLVWLASYPKSGNTWVRLFLANYLVNATQPLPINEAYRYALGDSLIVLYRKVAGKPVDPRNVAQILSLRPAVLKGIAGNDVDVSLVKTHYGNRRIRGVPLIPPELTRLAVYVLRNPLDLVLSYADHYGVSLEQAVDQISAADSWISANEINVMQYIGDWSQHVQSWTRTRDFPVATVRYEDMIADPGAAFGTVLRRMGVPVEAERLERAIRFSSFEELRRQEDATGFHETSRHAERFFRAGESGQWRTKLPAELVDRLCARHGQVMKRFGYLP